MDDIATGVAEAIGDVAGGVTESVGEAAGGAVESVASSLPDVVIIPDSPAELCPELGPVDLDRPVSAAVAAPERPAAPSAPVAAPGPTTAPVAPAEPVPDVPPEPARTTPSAPAAPAAPIEPVTEPDFEHQSAPWVPVDVAPAWQVAPQIQPVVEPETFAPYTPETVDWAAPGGAAVPLPAHDVVPSPTPAPSMPIPASYVPQAPAAPVVPAPVAPERRSWMVALNDWIARTATDRAQRREARAQTETREMTAPARVVTWLFGAPDPSWGSQRGLLSAPSTTPWSVTAGAPAARPNEFAHHPGVDASFANWLFAPGAEWSKGPDPKRSGLNIPNEWLTDDLTGRWVRRMRTARTSETVHGQWSEQSAWGCKFCAVGFLFDESDPDGWDQSGDIWMHKDRDELFARYGRDWLMGVSDRFEGGWSLDQCAGYVESQLLSVRYG